ncbi:MAG: hypothetical protein IKX06_00335 [Clostridia bacterium]|nr:hypothetical protein [Clostridia bacterium]
MKKNLLVLLIPAVMLSAVFLVLSGCSLISGVTGGLFDKPLSRNDGTDANVYVTGGKPLTPQTAAPDDPEGSGFDPFSLIGKAEWPDNEFTRHVPKPPFSLLSAAEEEDSFTAAFRNVTPEQVKAYVEEVKAAGFTVDPEIRDETVMGMSIYSYTASNSEGLSVTVGLTSGIGSISIGK